MRALSTYIEYLLMTQHYVFVPGLGGFMLADTEARFSKSPYQILAPRRIVQFNRFMTHDDGRLVDVLMDDAQLSYDEAVARIHTEVSKLLNQVQRDGRCRLGHLGQLFFDEDCHVAFRPADTQAIDPQHYALDSVKLKPWAVLEAEQQKSANPAPIIEMKPRQREDDVIMVPRYWLHRAAIALLVVCLTFANFLPLGTGDKGQLASMFDTNALLAHFSTLETQSWDSEWEAAEPEALATEGIQELGNSEIQDFGISGIQEPVVAEEPSVNNKTTKTTQTTLTQLTEIPAPTSTASAVEKQYFIIIASCTTREDAEASVKRFGRKGYNQVGIIEKDGRFRLFMHCFNARNDAESQLQLLREEPLFEKAWLLPVRTSSLSASAVTMPADASLSLIIKEKDNAKFTMELSHPNPPAERDQG